MRLIQTARVKGVVYACLALFAVVSFYAAWELSVSRDLAGGFVPKADPTTFDEPSTTEDLTAGLDRARSLALCGGVLSLCALLTLRFLFGREGTTRQRVARSLETEKLRRMDDSDRARVLNSVNQLTEVFGETRDIDAVLEEAVRAIREILDVENVVLELYGSEESLLRRHKVEGDLGEVDLGEEIYEDVIGKGRSRLINSLENTPKFERLAEKGWKSLLVTPLLQNKPGGVKEPIGLVAAVCTKQRDFTGHEQLLLNMFALQAAMIIENAQLYEKTRILAVRDGLTNLYNHRRFREVLDSLIAEAAESRSSFGLLMADIDNFKNFNDTHGHLKGDMVLTTVGEILLANVRGADTAARYGGEEFVVLLPDTDGDGCRSVGENMRSRIQQHRFEGEEAQPGGVLTITFGLAMYPADGQDAESLIDAADKALYVGKHRGRNRFVTFADLSEEERAAPSLLAAAAAKKAGGRAKARKKKKAGRKAAPKGGPGKKAAPTGRGTVRRTGKPSGRKAPEDADERAAGPAAGTSGRGTVGPGEII